MKLKIIFIALLISLLFACRQKKADFSIKAPKDWIVVDTVSGEQERSVSMHPPVYTKIPAFVANINISIQHSYSTGMYMHGVVSAVKRDAFFFEDNGEGTRTLNNYNIKWERHIMQYKQSAPRVEQKTYFIGDYNNVYMIVCTSKLHEMDKLQGKIDEVLTSFKIL
ncbi:MAG: hypothetical protein ABJB86_12985 [Bacteroidota bacterium]